MHKITKKQLIEARKRRKEKEKDFTCNIEEYNKNLIKTFNETKILRQRATFICNK